VFSCTHPCTVLPISKKKFNQFYEKVLKHQFSWWLTPSADYETVPHDAKAVKKANIKAAKFYCNLTRT